MDEVPGQPAVPEAGEPVEQRAGADRGGPVPALHDARQGRGVPAGDGGTGSGAVTRVVLLGASNVTIGFGVLTRLVRAGFRGPIDLRAALGHGRSYGAWSSLLVRSLPAITQCGLW